MAEARHPWMAAAALLAASAWVSARQRTPRRYQAADTGSAAPPLAHATAPPLSGPRPAGLAAALAVLTLICAATWAYAHRQTGPGPGVTGASGSSGRAETLMIRHGCSGCHVIPGVHSPGGAVGPPLAGIAGRAYIGGVLQNTPETMVRWIVDPRAIDPHAAMPVTGISEAEARDVTAYLRSH